MMVPMVRRDSGTAHVALAGRDRELGVLLDCLEASLHGDPRIIILLGEPGIGKTTLARATLEVAARRGAATAVGVSADDSGAPPYWPWTQIFRRLARETALAEIARAEGLSADLAGMAPELFGHGVGGGDRYAQFEAAARLLAATSSATPIAVLLDDVQWADAASLLLLRHLARVMGNERLFIAVSARDTEPDAGQALADLGTMRSATTLRLGGLDAGGVSAQLGALLSRPVGADEVATVVRLTGGNPFLVREISTQIVSQPLSDGDNAVTPSVSATMEARLAGLGDRAVRLLEAAAVLGLDFRVESVAVMSGSSVPAALDDLDRLLAAGLVEDMEASTWRFRHALLRDAVDARLSTSRQIALHRAAAEAIEAEGGDPSARSFEVARHWSAAAVGGDRLRAAAALEVAAREAMRQLAFETAGRMYRRALAAGAGALEDEARVRLWLGAAEAAARAADHGGRFEACEEAAHLARRLARPDLIAAAALEMSAIGPDAWMTAARRACEEALEALDPGDLSLRARLIAHHAETHVFTPELSAFEPATRTALEFAERSGDADALAAALRIRQFVLAGPAHLDDRAELALAMLSEGQRLALPRLEVQAHAARIDVELERGNLAGATAEIDAIGAAAGAMRDRSLRFQELTARAVLAMARGRFDDCRALASSAFSVFGPGGERNPYLHRSAVLANLSHHAGVDAATLTAIEEARPAVSGADAGLIAAVSAARVLAQAGRLDEAEALYEKFGPVESWRPPPHVELLVPTLGIAVAGYLDRASDQALLRERLLPFREHHVVCGTGTFAYFGPVQLWTGAAALAAGLIEEGIADLEAAVTQSHAAGTPGFEAEAKIELASGLLQRARPGDIPRARDLLAAAASKAARLNAVALKERAATAAARLGRDDSRLTRREQEVSGMVAEGLTNRAIAARLFLSERTVQNHIQHVLDKLDLANRAQIAAWVVRKNE
jgi:DNA-binding CsgD family transcriptional regulator